MEPIKLNATTSYAHARGKLIMFETKARPEFTEPSEAAHRIAFSSHLAQGYRTALAVASIARREGVCIVICDVQRLTVWQSVCLAACVRESTLEAQILARLSFWVGRHRKMTLYKVAK